MERQPPISEPLARRDTADVFRMRKECDEQSDLFDSALAILVQQRDEHEISVVDFEREVNEMTERKLVNTYKKLELDKEIRTRTAFLDER